MTEITYQNDVSGSLQKAQGSDGRLNVSSRYDTRAYYNSRDEGQSYTAAFNFTASAAGEYAAYLKNTSTTKELVISHIGINSIVASGFKLATVTGTAAAGTALIPFNNNMSSNNDAAATAMEGAAAASGITGLTPVLLIDSLYTGANSHEEFRIGDTLRLGQGDAIAIEVDVTAGGNVGGVMAFYYE